MRKELKDRALRVWANLRGWRTQRHIVVLESDDWGAMRAINRQAIDSMVAQGLPVDRSRYNVLDGLESRDDLESLFGVLSRHKDSRGRPAVMTLNVVMGNPDFDAIREDDFARFHHENIFSSYLRYKGEDLKGVWQTGMACGLVQPQFHAREHLNSRLWMRDLRHGREDARLAFDHRFYAQTTGTSSKHQRNYLAAYWAESDEEVCEIEAIVSDGLQQFESAFGFSSRTFVACNYVWPSELEPFLAQRGIDMIQAQRGNVQPLPVRGGRRRARRLYTGRKSLSGQVYGIRNVLFEPYMDPDVNWAERALTEISQAFRLDKPAIISTHRINFTSAMDAKHRDRSLRQLDQLLEAVRNTWGDVEFVSSDQLCEMMLAS